MPHVSNSLRLSCETGGKGVFIQEALKGWGARGGWRLWKGAHLMRGRCFKHERGQRAEGPAVSSGIRFLPTLKEKEALSETGG